jgi:hypothetical protein
MSDLQYVMIVKKGMFYAGPKDVNGLIPLFADCPDHALPMSNTLAKDVVNRCGLAGDDVDIVDIIAVDVAEVDGKLRITGLTAERDLKRYVYRRKGAESFLPVEFWSREEAVESAFKGIVGFPDFDVIETAWIRKYTMDDFADGHAGDIIEQMICQANEIAGDAASDFLSSLTKKEHDDLEYAVRNSILHWARRHGIGPHFFDVEDVQEHTRPVSAPTSEGSNP